MDKHLEVLINKYGLSAHPVAPQMFGSAGKEHMEKYGMFKRTRGFKTGYVHMMRSNRCLLRSWETPGYIKHKMVPKSRRSSPCRISV